MNRPSLLNRFLKKIPVCRDSVFSFLGIGRAIASSETALPHAISNSHSPSFSRLSFRGLESAAEKKNKICIFQFPAFIFHFFCSFAPHLARHFIFMCSFHMQAQCNVTLALCVTEGGCCFMWCDACSSKKSRFALLHYFWVGVEWVREAELVQTSQFIASSVKTEFPGTYF